MRKSIKNSRGQGMTEYIIIVALIAVAAIGVFRMFGNTVRGQAGVVAAEVGGQNSGQARQNANTEARAANTEGATQKNLSSFQQGAR